MARLSNKVKARVVMNVRYPKVSNVRQYVAIYIIKFGRWLLGLPFKIKMKVMEVK
jgi:hypothetical protein